ncbi:MAG: glycosyltransferase [Verrucomicrobiales bacterium]|nr:glycosyltransferase [Verrucomicrobiales bacterium]
MIHLLHSVDTLRLENGGLPLAVSELCSALATSDSPTSSPKVTLLTHPSQSTWQPAPQVHLQQTQSWHATLSKLHAHQKLKLIHQHGIWVRSSHTTCNFAQQQKLPIVLSPHGMLEPWALQHHAWRKKIALALYQKNHLKRATALHATSEAEAQQLRDLGLTQPIAIIANGVQLPDPEDPPPPHQGSTTRHALFLSRLHPKKGIPMLLQAWAQLKLPDWQLTIAGNDEAGHLAELKQQVQQLNITSTLTFTGPLYGEAKERAFQQAELFILPSHSENFAIVIAEALAHGLPVITTRETPWQSLEQHQCGWWVEAQSETIAHALKNATTLSPAKLQAMGQRGKTLVSEKFHWPNIAKQMLSYYHWLIDEQASTRPDFVI